MRHPRALPAEIAGRAFSVGDALGRGVGRGRLQSSDLTQPFHGVRAPVGLGVIESFAPRLRPGDRFSHSTAAALWGLPLPARLEQQLHVTSRAGLDATRARGVVGHETSSGSAVLWRGHPVSDPISTYLEVASLMSLEDLTAVGDHLVLDPRVLEPGEARPLASLGELRVGARNARTRGVHRARAAALLAREGVESPQETALRLLLLGAGLPEPVCGFELRDDGRRVGWFDLAWPEFRAITEYDGDEHRTSTRQYDRDIQRFDWAADLGWRVVRVRRRGLTTHAGRTIERVRRAMGGEGR